jgi:hypothetical protein
MTITLNDYVVTTTINISGDATWTELLDTVLHSIQNPNGYVITREKLLEWAEHAQLLEEEGQTEA